MALGADRRDITRLVLSSAGALTACGVALGVAMAVAASRWIEAQLFGVSATEPVVYLGVSGLVVTVALAATWRPARAASHVDPAIVLKAE